MIARAPRSREAIAWGSAFVQMTRESPKPVVVNWPSSTGDHGELLQVLEQHGVPCFTAPRRAVRALAKLTRFAKQQREHLGPRRAESQWRLSRQPLAFPSGACTLGEHESKRILSVYGVPVVAEVLLDEAALAAMKASPLPFPVAVKAESPDLPHKTEAGAVRLGINDFEALREAAFDVLAAARAHVPGARINGVLVQQMASGLEVMVGAVNDPYFGPTITFGLGGLFAELLRDVSRRFAPFDRVTAREMIEEIKGAPLLNGYRGREPLDIDALADALSRVSMLVADHADRIQELDVNPLFVRRAGEGVVAADALIVLR